VVLLKGMLFGEMMKAGGAWLWRSDMTGNKSEVGLGCFGRLAVTPTFHKNKILST
jgi:hypothetical protein